MKKFLFLSFSLVIVFQSFAQKPPIRFGKPSMVDLKKSVYKIDTTAPAIILCNYGTFDPGKLEFDHIVRIKILKKDGVHWGNWTFKTWSTASIRGKTFNLVNGKIVASRLSSKSIYKENVVNGYYVTKIAMPDVKVGSLIDIEISYTGIPPSWYFQRTIPVLYTELDIESSDNIQFTKDYFGYIPFKVATDGRYVTVNVPAFQPEPYMDSKNNYMAHFEFDLSQISIPGQFLHDYASSWGDIKEFLLKNDEFGGALKSGGHFFKKIGDSIKSVTKTDVGRVKAALAVVHRIKWNKDNSLTSSSNSDLKYVFTKGEGNSADINLSLIALLWKTGIEAYPVIMRTRDQGRLSNFNPTLFNLNYVLAYAKVNGRFYLIDGTEKDLPFPYLPKRCYNGRGRVILPNTTEWVNLTNHQLSTKSVFYNLTLNKNQELTGTENTSYSGQYAYSFRENYKSLGSHKKYVNKLMSQDNDLTVKKDTLINLSKPNKALSEKASVIFKNQVMQLDTVSYLYPIPVRMTENPFKLKKRTYPVDFVYPFMKSGVVIINIPSGYKIVKLPKSVRYILPNNGGSFLFQAGVARNMIQVVYRLAINKPVFIQKAYPSLKGLYMKAILKESQPVVLKKL